MVGSITFNASTPAMARALAELAPKGEAQVLEDARHMMQMTHPDRVSERLGEFIGRVVASGMS